MEKNMQLNPTTVTLICGAGSIVSSALTYMKRHAVQKIYIVYSRFNDPARERKIREISDRIERSLAGINIDVSVMHVKINEKRFYESIMTLSRIYDLEKCNTVITDLTGGSKIISYIMFYTHCYSRYKLHGGSKMVYFLNGDDTPREMPALTVDQLGDKVEGLLFDMHRYCVARKSNEQNPVDRFPKTLLGWLRVFGSRDYTAPTMYRYKKELRERGLVEMNSNEITMKGMVYLSTMEVSNANDGIDGRGV